MKLVSTLLFILVLTIISACYQVFDPKTQPYPYIRTLTAIPFNSNSAQFNGEVVKFGLEPITDFGFEFAEMPTPTYGEPPLYRFSLGSELVENFSARPTLQPVHVTTQWWVKAYVVTVSLDTVYGNKVYFER